MRVELNIFQSKPLKWSFSVPPSAFVSIREYRFVYYDNGVTFGCKNLECPRREAAISPLPTPKKAGMSDYARRDISTRYQLIFQNCRFLLGTFLKDAAAVTDAVT